MVRQRAGRTDRGPRRCARGQGLTRALPLPANLEVLEPRVLLSAATGNFYVASDTGDDSFPGTLAQPFATIQKAAQVAEPGYVVWIRGGTYRETVRPARSGTPGLPITFRAFGNEQVVIDGTEALEGWTAHSGNIYKTTLPWDLGHENQIFSSGQTLWEARWPNIPSYTMDGFAQGMAVADEGTGPTTIADSALVGPADVWTGATIWIRAGRNGDAAWLAQTSTVTGFDPGTRTLTIAPLEGTGPQLDPAPNNDYYLNGTLELLDAPGEWYLDPESNTLYVHGPDGQIPRDITAKRRVWGFDLDDRSHVNVEGIDLFAAGITARNSHHISLSDLDARWIYHSDQATQRYESQLRTGIVFVGHHNELTSSTVAWSTGAGVFIEGADNRVVNNHIHDIGYLATYGSSVDIEHATRTLISHNTFEENGRFAIKFGDTGAGKNVIQYNDLSRFMLLSGDGGGLYGWGRDGNGTEIHHNVFHDLPAGPTRVGLYLDSFTSSFLIHHNVFYDLEGDAIRINAPSQFHLLYNNTTHNVTRSVARWGEEPYDTEWDGIRLLNNVFSDPVEWGTGHVEGHNAGTTDFVDAAAGDFRPAPSSPLIDAGAVVPGVTEGFEGLGPDIGAFEADRPPWSAGHDFTAPPAVTFRLAQTPWSNRLENGSFNNRLEQWTKTGALRAVAEVTAGSPAWRNRGHTRTLRLGGSGPDGLEQVVSGLEPDTEYRLSAWAFVDPGGEVALSVRDFGGQPRSVTWTETMYTPKDLVFRTGPGLSTATIAVTTTGSSPNTFAWVDDLGLVRTGGEGPPPATATVSAVSVASSAWSDPFLQALDDTTDPAGRTLPWIGLDTVRITFDRSVQLSIGDVRVTGARVADYPIEGFSWDGDGLTATWALTAPIEADYIWIVLSGSAVGAFDLRAGDVDGSGSVTEADALAVRDRQFEVAGSVDYRIWEDLDGSGTILGNDLIQARNRVVAEPPAAGPAAPDASSQVLLDDLTSALIGAATVPTVESTEPIGSLDLMSQDEDATAQPMLLLSYGFPGFRRHFLGADPRDRNPDPRPGLPSVLTDHR